MAWFGKKRGEDAPVTFAARCRKVRTPQGRTAHLRHPVVGVLCGWPGADAEADPAMRECKSCRAFLAEIGEAEAS